MLFFVFIYMDIALWKRNADPFGIKLLFHFLRSVKVKSPIVVSTCPGRVHGFMKFDSIFGQNTPIEIKLSTIESEMHVIWLGFIIVIDQMRLCWGKQIFKVARCMITALKYEKYKPQNLND